ncbi:hypothetical protein O181_024306 [Austropuccinia psidii MF-1]|uniref:Uncharacterized protein n=1 Tax=Austropuccinia psidii MF-1 TaxID=1389203 RepID=A0A9Q3CGI1_9BASI|nr:hypothetical protein [Austropuccinia psidii MF-1]
MNDCLKNQTLLSFDKNKELEITPAFEKEGPVASTSYKLAPESPDISPKNLRRSIEVPITIKVGEKARPIGTDLTHKGTGFPNWNFQPWKVGSIWLNPYGVHIQGSGKDEHNLST